MSGDGTEPDPDRLDAPVLAARVAHDVRGAVSVLLSALQELEHQLGEDADARRVLQMARRATGKLECTAGRLDAVAHRDALTMADVDLEPMLQRAASTMAALERRESKPLSLPPLRPPTRIRVVAGVFETALADVFRWALRFAADGVDVEVSRTVAPAAVVIRIVVSGVKAVPAQRQPFADPLGLAALLLRDMRGTLSSSLGDDAVTLLITVPAGGAG